jgi:hypothetical protein
MHIRGPTAPLLPDPVVPRDAAPMTTTAPVIDGDGHVMEPADLWVERMDHDKWGDWIPRRVTEDDIYDTTSTGGQVRSRDRILGGNAVEAHGLGI